MARATKTYNCFLLSVTLLESWEKLEKGGVPSLAEALAILNKEALESGGAPSTATGLEVEANKKKIVGKFVMPTLAEGEIPVKLSMHVYGKAKTAALDVKFGPAVGVQEMNSTTAQWWKTVLSGCEGKRLSELEEWTIESIKSQGGIVYAAYLELETETERSQIVTAGSGAAFNGAASAGGVVETSGVATGPIKVGETVSVVVATVGAGATSVTDARGNTYTKDDEEAAVGATIQFWSARVATELKVGDKLTLSGFTALAKVIVSVTDMFAFQPTLDTAAFVEGVGETLELATASLRAAQGDVLRVAAVALGEAASLSFAGSSAEVTTDPAGVQKQAGLSLVGAWAKKPPEGAPFVVKGKWGASQSYAVVAVAYDVLATAGVSTAPAMLV